MECRVKWIDGVSLVAQLEPDIQHAVFGNAATIIAFRVGPEDASVLAKEFQPSFDLQDLMNLANRDIYLKLMIDGVPSKPFSASTNISGSSLHC